MSYFYSLKKYAFLALLLAFATPAVQKKRNNKNQYNQKARQLQLYFSQKDKVNIPWEVCVMITEYSNSNLLLFKIRDFLTYKNRKCEEILTSPHDKEHFMMITSADILEETGAWYDSYFLQPFSLDNGPTREPIYLGEIIPQKSLMLTKTMAIFNLFQNNKDICSIVNSASSNKPLKVILRDELATFVHYKKHEFIACYYQGIDLFQIVKNEQNEVTSVEVKKFPQIDDGIFINACVLFQKHKLLLSMVEIGKDQHPEHIQIIDLQGMKFLQKIEHNSRIDRIHPCSKHHYFIAVSGLHRDDVGDKNEFLYCSEKESKPHLTSSQKRDPTIGSLLLNDENILLWNRDTITIFHPKNPEDCKKKRIGNCKDIISLPGTSMFFIIGIEGVVRLMRFW